jgi:Replication-relaxation
MTRESGCAVPRSGPVRPLAPRDAQVVELVGRFRLMTAEQIRTVAFPGLASKTPLDRSLMRLTAGGYLRRLARFVGGFGGGSGQYVYQLGRMGWRSLGKGGTYRPLRVVDLHTLTITECFVALHSLERGGELTVISYQPEPGCHLNVAGTPLTPDAYMELGLSAPRLKFRYWLEIDRDTENPDTIKNKCVWYWRAYQACQGDVFPLVVFVVPDTARRREIERVVTVGPAEAHALFQVAELNTFVEVIHWNMRQQR